MQSYFLQNVLWHTKQVCNVRHCAARIFPGTCGKTPFLLPHPGQLIHTSCSVSALEQRRPESQVESSTTDDKDTAKAKSDDAKPEDPKFLPRSDLDQDPLTDTVQKKYFSETKVNPEVVDVEKDPLQDHSIGLFQRFQKTFKQYGKVVIPVHLLTSSIWFGTFYYAASKGVNVVPFLEFVGAPKGIIQILNHSTGGNALTAYALYKLATPARYTVTLGGTSLAVKYLRSRGYLSTPPLMRVYIQDRMEETKERFSEKMEETKELLTEKIQETKDMVSFRKKKE
ncbi:uncharacterized protein C18orf19 homolog A [Leucoraja erinacea]|uniref:uncharacterized protein C18orf19 homolog A n=1 Tax=Leucoraja erinaceus TaxID=7782 RepID=UPI0024589311|nr:uncharacterized protein C18orf19 homolog A [Leucoraja erinacea]XP_055490324.1 uncharacterized protein C18orf19 homolog A [Leucoraja erinacea]